MLKVVITGVSSGIGYSTAKILCNSGYYVYGSVRTEKDLNKLSKELGENCFFKKVNRFSLFTYVK